MRSSVRAGRSLNTALKGYTVELPRLDLNPFGFSVTLRTHHHADAHPKPAITHVAALHAGVDYARCCVPAHKLASRTEPYINLRAFRAETIHSALRAGWQRAEEIYPLKINRIRVRNGQVTYIDNDPSGR
jgi:hypothetical protein